MCNHGEKCMAKTTNLGLKAENQLQNKNHTEDWELSLSLFTIAQVYIMYIKVKNTLLFVVICQIRWNTYYWSAVSEKNWLIF